MGSRDIAILVYVGILLSGYSVLYYTRSELASLAPFSCA